MKKLRRWCEKEEQTQAAGAVLFSRVPAMPQCGPRHLVTQQMSYASWTSVATMAPPLGKTWQLAADGLIEASQ